MAPIDGRKLFVDVGDGQEFDRQLVGRNRGADLGHVIGVAPAIDRQCRISTPVAQRSKRLDRRERSALRIEAADYEEFCDGRVGGLHLAEKGLRGNSRMDHLAVTDAKSG